MKNTVVRGDVLDILALIPDESIHLTCTSPPYYNAREYAIYPTYQAYLDFLKQVFTQLYAKTKEGRFFVLNTSPVITARASRQHASTRHPIPFDLHSIVTQIGWEFIDDIIWVKPEASVKHRNGGFMQHRKPLGYKPNCITEYVFVYRKKSDKLIDWNIRLYDKETTEKSRVTANYETTNVWYIAPCADKTHPAVFPEALCDRVIQYYSFKGDLIFDPFAGIGTLGRSALKNERHFFMTELNPAYFNEMKKRFAANDMFKPKQVTFLSKTEFQSTINENARVYTRHGCPTAI